MRQENSESNSEANISEENISEENTKEADSSSEHEHEHEHEQDKKKQNLLRHPNLWRAGQLADLQRQTQQGIPTGFAELDRHLPGNGWPKGGLMELLPTSAGIGELRLLAPALATLSQAEARWIAWVNPPFIPYAPALSDLGIDIDKVLLIHPKSHQDALWALERTSKSGSCSAVLAWIDEQKLNPKDTQRLQVAAKQGRTLTCLMRPRKALQQSSMAELRLALEPSGQPGGVRVDITKRRGGWPVSALHLAVANATATQHRTMTEIREQLSLWRELRRPDSVSHEQTPPDTGILPFPQRRTGSSQRVSLH